MEFYFYFFFSICCLISALGVVVCQNPISAVFWLIFAFCHATAVLIIFGLEFLAMLFLMVYIGAIAVLFLFVVMMLDIHLAEIKKATTQYIPVGVILSFLFFVEILMAVDINFIFTDNFVTDLSLDWKNWFSLKETTYHIHSIGIRLYRYHFDLFFIAGVLLLVAMIGAIVLTLQISTFSKRQNIYQQTFKNFKKTIKFIGLRIVFLSYALFV
jgi:NADH-quinone oxidoreductase subunit J